jgi:glycosyltransferase involved in cell wall biosynthesis
VKTVSVILTCYNGAQWLGEAITSILSQTYCDFELVIVNDGSTDRSKEIISSFLYDDRVRYFYQRNKGFSAAINRGIKESTGELIGFIGQDDLWLPRKLELQMLFLNNNKKIDLIHSSYFSINPDGQIINLLHPEMPNFSTKSELIRKLFMGNLFGFETVLVKRKCFIEAGLFDERMAGFSDYDMWLRLAGKYNLGGFIATPLVKKREHKLQISVRRIEDVLKDEFLIAEKAIECYPFLKKLERKKMASLYYALGIVLLQKGDYKKAKQKLTKVIKYQPWNLKAVAIYMAPSLYTFMRDHYIKIMQKPRWIEAA